ncbi:MAG TPA: hypothetical protein VFZ67_09055 [Nitrososphaera sp.]
MLSLSAVSIIGSSGLSYVQAQPPQSNQNSDTTVIVVKNNNNNVTLDDMKQRLHSQLDGAIVAAQNNDTFGVLVRLGKITEGLAATSTLSYFLFDVPLPNNGTTLSNTSKASAASLNQGTTTTTITTSSTSSQINPLQ